MILTRIIKELLPSTWNNLLKIGFNLLLILVAIPSSNNNDARTKKGNIEGNNLVLNILILDIPLSIIREGLIKIPK